MRIKWGRNGLRCIEIRLGKMIMRRGFKLAVLALCIGGSASLAGCADSIYPRLPNLGGIGSPLLTPSEQQQAIDDLSTEQKTHGEHAAEEIEQR